MSTTVIKNYCFINENKASQDLVRVIRPPAPPARTCYPPAAILFALLPVTVINY